jgi:hypothetical protein
LFLSAKIYYDWYHFTFGNKRLQQIVAGVPVFATLLREASANGGFVNRRLYIVLRLADDPPKPYTLFMGAIHLCR